MISEEMMGLIQNKLSYLDDAGIGGDLRIEYSPKSGMWTACIGHSYGPDVAHSADQTFSAGNIHDLLHQIRKWTNHTGEPVGLDGDGLRLPYWLFVGGDSEQGGGMSDLYGTYPTMVEALKGAKEAGAGYTWKHILDVEKQKRTDL